MITTECDRLTPLCFKGLIHWNCSWVWSFGAPCWYRCDVWTVWLELMLPFLNIHGLSSFCVRFIETLLRSVVLPVYSVAFLLTEIVVATAAAITIIIIYLFTQQMQYNTHMLNTMIKWKVKNYVQFKISMANELRPYSLFDSCNWVTNWINMIFTC